MKIEFQLNEDEIKEVALGHLFGAHQSLGSLSIWRFYWLIAAIITIPLGLLIFEEWTTVVLSILIYIAIMKVLEKAYSRRFYARYFSRESNQFRLQKWKIELTKNGILMNSMNCSQNFKWTAIYHQNETKDFILIWFSGREHISIPKRIFSNSIEKAEFIALISNKGQNQ